MNPEREERIEALIEEARALPREQCHDYLETNCGDDADLRREVELLLGVEEERIRFLETPCFENIGGMPDENVDGEYSSQFIGRRIGRYTIRRVLGAGGMAVVFEAEQEHPRRPVALKLMRRGLVSRTALRRFRYEAEILASFHHPNIAQIYEADVHDDGTGGVPYFAMEYIADAKTITDYAAEKKLSIPERLKLFTSVCEAVHHGHQKGVIHRDLKPQNILVDAQGQVKVIDFGVARATDADLAVTTMPTEAGRIVGTLAYMNPEQCTGQSSMIDARSDVYSLGVVLYELLCDRAPFDLSGMRIDEAARFICETEPRRPGTINTLLRGDLDTITRTALEKAPERRYQSALELAEDVRRHLRHEPIMARPPSAVYHLRKFVRRNRAVTAALAGLFLALTAGLIATSVLYLRAEQQAERAEVEAQRALAAEADAEARAAELEKVVEFQADQLSGLDTVMMGIGLREQIFDMRRSSLTRAAANGDLIDRKLRELDEALLGVNFTNLALTALEKNIFERAIQAIDEQFSDQPLVQARLLETLSKTLYELGLLERAKETQSRALAIHRKLLGAEHPNTLTSIHGIGVLLIQLGPHDEAERYLREALEARRRTFGDEHRDTLASLRALGALFRLQHRLELAEQYLRQANDAQRRVLGATHPETLNSIQSLGVLLRQKGRFDEAEQYFREALDGYRSTLGDLHPRTLNSLNSIAVLLTQRGLVADAERYLRQAMEGYRSILGDEHPETLRSIGNAGALLRELGRYDEAQPLLREAMEGRRRVIGEDHPETLISTSHMAVLMRELGELDEAKRIGAEVVETAERALPDGHWRTATFLEQHSRTLAVMHRFDEAEPLALKAQAILQRVLGVDHQRTISAIEHLAELYQDWYEHDPDAGHDGTAEQWRAKLRQEKPNDG